MTTSVKIAVIGDIMLDRYWFGHAKRISPEAPIPVININNQEDRLGGAANVALNISALNTKVTLTGLIGHDNEGALVKTLCQQQGITPQFITRTEHTTITKLRIISRQQHMLRCDFEEAVANTQAFDQETQKALFATIDDADLIVLSDYGKGFLCQPQILIDYARTQNKPIIIDPKGAEFSKYQNATLLTPNRTEFEAVVGPCHDEATLLAKGEQLRATLNLEALLITRSEQGMTLIERGKEALTFPAKARDVFDVTGAGDTVLAHIATALCTGKSLPEAAHIANIAASIVVGKLGASQVTIKELNEALGALARAHHLVLSKSELRAAMAQARSHNERIVMTNGCFDLLHRGHVSYLEQARNLGDRLIVALNSDASVKRLKGEDRPIMDEVSRATVLASLRSVDWVVIFDEDTPEAIISELLPDVLVKGSDYTVDQIAGAQAVLRHGGHVELIDFIAGYSTTQAIEKIQKR